MAEDPTFRVTHRRADRPGRDRRHGRAAPRNHRRPPEARVRRRSERRQAAGRLQGNAHRGRPKATAGSCARPAAAASSATAEIRLFPLPPGTGYQFENEISRRLDSARIHQADRPGHPGSAHARHSRRLPDRRRPHRAVRRFVPRSRLVGNGVQDRRLDGVPGRGQEGRRRADGTDHARRSGLAEGLPRRRDGRPGVAPRQASSRRKIAAARRSSPRACR